VSRFEHALPERLEHVVVCAFASSLLGVLLALVGLEEVDLFAVKPAELVGHLHLLVPLLAFDVLKRSKRRGGKRLQSAAEPARREFWCWSEAPLAASSVPAPHRKLAVQPVAYRPPSTARR
jgi:hypothetical protein